MQDQQTYQLILNEIQRQREGLEMIPSENYVSEDVLKALGTVFTNKYSEGYPNRRYYGGQENTDQLETIAIERAKRIFHADHANVQALSGAPANTAVYFAWCNPGEKIMAMELSHGGHLTHGQPVTHQAKLFNFIRYRIKDIETGEIDYDQMYEVAKKEKPKILLAGFTCYPRNLNYDKFYQIAKEIGAVAMADMAHISGLIAAGVMQNPLDQGFHVMTTTTHKTLRGPRGALILSKGIVGNPLKAPEKTIENLPTLIDRSVFPGLQGGPHMNTIAGIAVALYEAEQQSFKEYGRQVLINAKVLSNELMRLGCKLVTNGTDNHLMLIDCIKSFGITGDIVEKVLDSIGITVNKNAIPDDPNPPFKPSGIRLGTPAITTRGLKENEMLVIANIIVKAIKGMNEETLIKNLKEQVKELSTKYPVPVLSF